MILLDNWPRLLADYIEIRSASGFAWGKNDCCTFSAGAVQALTGIDVLRQIPVEDYSTKSHARAIIRRLGGIEKIPASAGLAEVPIATARRGDIVSHCQRVGSITLTQLGVCLGQKSAFVSRRGGLAYFSTLNCRKAWRIG